MTTSATNDGLLRSETKYIVFQEQQSLPGRKTRRFFVLALRDGATLGEILWYGAWRQYAFFPEAHMIFNPTCLNLIAAFCGSQTKRHQRAS